jgi:WD40 repeat protein
VVFSQDNHWLVTGSWDHTAHLWNLTAKDPTASPVVLRGHKDDITALAISPDNHWLVTGSSNGEERRWDLTTRSPASNPVEFLGAK